MAQWAGVSGKQKASNNTQPVYLNGGLNRSGSVFDIGPNEAYDMNNMGNFKDNVLSVRPGKTNLVDSFNNLFRAGQYGNEIHFTELKADGSKRWYYHNGTTVVDLYDINALGIGGTFLEFNTDSKHLLYFGPGGAAVCDSSHNVSAISAAPLTSFVTVDDYRVYALIGNTLKCSDEGSFTNWDPGVYEGADSIPITSMVGTGTAICTHKDTVICWSDQTMHVLYGNDPYDFEFSESKPHGCISQESIVQLDGTYFMDYGEFKRYVSGDSPQVVSDKIKPWLEGINLNQRHKIVTGKQGKYIYLSIPYQDSGANVTFEYNTKTGNWYKLNEGYVDFVTIGESLYGLKGDRIVKLNTGTTNLGNAIEYSYVTGMFNNGFNKQALSSIPMIINKPTGTTFSISINTKINAPEFEYLYSVSGKTELQNVKINIPMHLYQDVDWYQLKFEGTGHGVEVYMVDIDKRIKLR